MPRNWFAVLLLAAGAAMGDGDMQPGQRDEAPNALDANRVAQRPGTKPDEANHVNTLDQQFAAILAEYDTAIKTANAEAEKGPSDFSSYKIYTRLMPDEPAFSHRMVDLAATQPASTAARDALLWVIDKPTWVQAAPTATSLPAPSATSPLPRR